jgi:thioredoxin 2
VIATRVNNDDARTVTPGIIRPAVAIAVLGAVLAHPVRRESRADGNAGRGWIVVTLVSPRIVTCATCGTRNRVPAAASGRPRCASCKADLPWIADATDSTLATAVDTSSLVLLDLWAPWCGPCRMVAPVLERLAERYAGRLKVVKVNVDDNPATARAYDASSIPTLVMIRDGKVVGRVVGARPEAALAAQVEPLLPAAS